ncbi:hypothetical protein VMCG_03393 [Cytospora schulzeri]|uniref:DNA repair exonuclease rad1 n=1 Tax=Cytospora schulzeri TaxID=448051 RepID=A0A423WWT8_9PEZI|nr:hypothetical protein VMCG_03393 [Valsa malicola]
MDSMDSKLIEVWQTAAGNPFLPTIGKGTQFLVAFVLLLLGLSAFGIFALNRSIVAVPVIGIPASLAIAYGTVYMFCAVHVEITEEGIKFAADQSRVMQGVANLNKSLFTNYTLNIPQGDGHDDGDDENETNHPSFQISLAAFLETLQIFGASDAAARQAKADADPYRSNLRNYRPDAFSNQTLGMTGTCMLSYAEEGGPFSILLEESGVNTTCNLNTYLPEAPEDIPFDRDDVSFKVIMQSRWLLDALVEMAHSNPTRLTIMASRQEPYLRLSCVGPLGGSSVDFAKGRDLLETFSVRDRWVQTFKFDMIKSAIEAMRVASKVSLRGDGQGVLSLQFMVEMEGGGLNFLIFTFVPYVAAEDDEEDEEEPEGEEGEETED